jgi:hypothetical protein
MRNALSVCLSVYPFVCVSTVPFVMCFSGVWGVGGQRQVDSVTHDDVLCPFVRLAVLLLPSLLLQFRKGLTRFFIYVEAESNCFALQELKCQNPPVETSRYPPCVMQPTDGKCPWPLDCHPESLVYHPCVRGDVPVCFTCFDSFLCKLSKYNYPPPRPHTSPNNS